MVRKLFAIVCLTALLVAAFPFAAAAQDEIESVCLVTDEGGVDDGNFNFLANEGMERAADDFDLDTTLIESDVPGDYVQNINICLSEGYDVIVTVGFAMLDATLVAANENPGVMFIGIDHFYAPEQALPNLVGIQFREDQAGFLVGALAALMSEGGTIGGVYGRPFPPVVKFRNGYEQGARYINPDINTIGVYIDSFEDRAAGTLAAEQLLGEGVDVLFGAGGKVGTGAIVRAALDGIYVIGVDNDEYYTPEGFNGGEVAGSEYIISSALKRVDNGVYEMLAVLVDGTGFPENSYYVPVDGVDFAPPHDSDVPQEITDQVNAIKADLLDGSIETGVDPISGLLLSGENEEIVVIPVAEPTAEATAEGG